MLHFSIAKQQEITEKKAKAGIQELFADENLAGQGEFQVKQSKAKLKICIAKTRKR